jgi:hypothetical protein
MDRYPPIAKHGLIGDLQTAALVTTDACAITLDDQLDQDAGEITWNR